MNTPRVILNNGKTLDEALKLIRNQAKLDIVFSNVCLVFSTRERARSEITLQSLDLTMKRQRFTYSKDQLSTVLRFLATVGIGRLETDAKRRVVALRDIQVNLQSVGQSALSDDKKIPEIKPFHSKTAPRYVHFQEQAPPPQVPPIISKTGGNRLILEFNGTVLNVSLRNDANIGELLTTALKHGALV